VSLQSGFSFGLKRSCLARYNLAATFSGDETPIPDGQSPFATSIQASGDSIHPAISIEAHMSSQLDSTPDRPPSGPIKLWTLLIQHDVICQRVFYHVTRRADKTIYPYFKQGMLRGYLAQPVVKSDQRWPGSEDEQVYKEREIVFDNIEFPELLVSKKFALEYLKAFYRQHSFSFYEPRAARWFMNTIGPQNVHNLRELEIDIYGGFDNLAQSSALTSESSEEIWFNFFCWLKSRHNLNSIVIEIMDMPTNAFILKKIREEHITTEDAEQRETYAQKLRGAILDVRGLKKARLYDKGRVIFKDAKTKELGQLYMQQSRPESDAAQDMRKLSLAETLARVRESAPENSEEEEQYCDEHHGNQNQRRTHGPRVATDQLLPGQNRFEFVMNRSNTSQAPWRGPRGTSSSSSPPMRSQAVTNRPPFASLGRRNQETRQNHQQPRGSRNGVNRFYGSRRYSQQGADNLWGAGQNHWSNSWPRGG
jgi:hypothetical protein